MLTRLIWCTRIASLSFGPFGLLLTDFGVAVAYLLRLGNLQNDQAKSF